MKRLATFTLGLVLILGWAPALLAQNKTGEATGLVGRITFIDGQLLRYVYAEQDWVATVKDAPFGLEDAVYSNDTGKAEFQLPNGTWARVGADTQIQLIALRDDVTEMDIAAGTARFYAKGRNAVIKVTTPFGYVLAQPDTAFDVYVGDSSVEVICLGGIVELVLNDGEAKFAVEAGKPSIISDGRQALEGDGTVDSSWDDWNLKREEFWVRRVQVKGDSVKYLPPSLHDDAYDLDQHGRWERVHYQGGYQTFWRPTRVVAGWQPYSVGRWTVWYDDNTWIPGEPFGYVTHHYGNWVYVNNFWYWAPPVTVRVGSLGGCACWYPGRVAWIHSGVRVGWVPLAPTEVYYSHRYWGPASVMVANVGGVGISVGSLAFARHAVVVPQPYFYSVNSYYNVRVRNINRTTIINNYRVAPVVSNTVINNYDTMRNRYVYNTNLANVAVKPHQAVVSRINQNRTFAEQQRTGISARTLSESAAQVRQANPTRGAQGGAQQVQRPQVSSRLVPANQVNRPASEVQFNQRQLKSQARPPREVGRQTGPAGVGAAGPARGATQAGPGAAGRPERVAPPSTERRQQLQQERLQGSRQPQADQRRSRQERRQQQTEMQRQQRLQRQQLDGRSRTQQRGAGEQRSLQQQRGREPGSKEMQMREPRSIQQRPDRGSQMQRQPRGTQTREQRSMQRPDRGSQTQRQPQSQRQQMQRQPQGNRQPQMQMQRQPQGQRQQPKALPPQGQGPQQQQGRPPR
ncbi:MAG: FecR domain-containing protein [Desulfobacteraceae bacterium]|nr:FecR domain-containing protein [Desulfobacteraceae bacterium]